MADASDGSRPASAGLVAAGTSEPAWPFVGRLRELGELSAVLVESAAGRDRLFMVTGEPGIGKSRLMEEFARLLADQDWRVLTGRCWEHGGAPAYWPWIQVVRAAGSEFEECMPAPAGTGGRPGASAPLPAPTPADPESDRFRLFDGVARFLTKVADDRRLLVVLDDLHAADEPSLLLLRFLAQTLAGGRIILLGAYREAEQRVHESAQLFADLARVGHRIRLHGLSRSEVGTYISRVAARAAPEAMVAKVHDVTAGNPFFVGEVVRVLLAEGSPADAGQPIVDPVLRIPEEVHALIRRRVAGLEREAIANLRVAAVIGREFELGVLQRVSRLSVPRLADALSEAVRAGILAEDTAVPGRYAFTHDLVRETLYQDMPAARRLVLHRTIGLMLQALFDDDLEPHLAELAHHFTKSAPLGDAAPAVEFSVRAGDRAAGLLAYEDAARHYARALRLLPMLEHADGEQRCAVLLRLGDVLWRAGDDKQARRSFEEAAAVASRLGAAEMLARAALGHGEAGDVAAAVAGGGLVGGAGVTGFGGETTHVHLLEQALASLQALLVALYARHWATLAPDLLGARLANAAEMLHVAITVGDEEAAFLARHARLHCLLERCDIAGVDAELEAMADLADRTRQPFHRWRTANARAMRALLDGRLEEAERLARGALEIGGLRQSDYVPYLFEHAVLVAIRWMQGRLGELREAIRFHGERYSSVARWRNALVAVELADERAARAEVERHALRDFADLPRDGLWLLHQCSLAEACVLLGDERRAARLYQLLSPYADRNAISMTTMPFGPVALRLGMVAAMLGRWEEAEGHFQLAMERCTQLGAPAITARVLYERAKMLVARGEEADLPSAAELLPGRRASAESWTCPGSGTVSRRLPPRSIRAALWPARGLPRRVPSSGVRATTGRWPTRARQLTSGT